MAEYEEWLLPFLEARYTRLAPKPNLSPEEERQIEQELAVREKKAIEKYIREREHQESQKEKRVNSNNRDKEFESILQPGRGKEILADLPAFYWFDLMGQYRKRQLEERRKIGAEFNDNVDFDHFSPPSPGIKGTTNWIPIGPSVVRRGQAIGRPAISGRASGIAIAPLEKRVYVATADGGAWRSDDGGATWLSLMDNFDIDPVAFASTSLACGAIAIDENAPDRIYVGTGEGDTNNLFTSRLTYALPSYRGVGPLRSDDGGATWHNELTAPGSPTLVGQAFYALAVDPLNRENVVAATNLGLYRRESNGKGGFHWVQKRTGIHSSVVTARTGTTRVTTFFAAAWEDQVYMSNDGNTWTAVGTGFPSSSSNTERIGLAVQRNNPNVLYAMVSKKGFKSDIPGSTGLHGIYRLDNRAGPWHEISGAPDDLFGKKYVDGDIRQGDYDLAISVDPSDANIIYVGGSGRTVGLTWVANIHRGKISRTGTGTSVTYSMITTPIGDSVHADVHSLVHAPGSSSTLWVCCDGGVFKTTDATASASFKSCNVGLGTLSTNYIGQHPTQPSVIFCGLQDNGTAKYNGEECWTHVLFGDGGYCVVNWNDPFKILVYANGSVYRAEDGGKDYVTYKSLGSWKEVTPPKAGWEIMAQPLVTTPRNVSNPSEAEIVAFGAGESLFMSADFGSDSSTWLPPLSIDIGGGAIYSMVFASADRLYLGTTTGHVYRSEYVSIPPLDAHWESPLRLDKAPRKDDILRPFTPGLSITDIAVDPSDSRKIYVTLGGVGDFRHVWYYNGTSWEARSGPGSGSPTSLLDVEHNAIVIDTGDPLHAIYVAADIGVWRSIDSGMNWTLLEAGLPDAAVLDLQIHKESRLLRAALHGRGIFEYKLDTPPAPPDVELYIRDTMLDTGRGETKDGLDDPTMWPRRGVYHYESPNIKVDVPSALYASTPTTKINFYEFNDKIVDGSSRVVTIEPTSAPVINHVYVEVHNRGISTAANVQVMLLLTRPSVGFKPLPKGYATNVQKGTPISTADWQTVGFRPITNLRVGLPQVVEFDLPSTMLPPPASLPGDAHKCLVAIVHASDDRFLNTEINVDRLTTIDRKVAQKNLNIVQFVGWPPRPGSAPGVWAAIEVNGQRERHIVCDLLFDLEHFVGYIGVLVPKENITQTTLVGHKVDQQDFVKHWAEEHSSNIENFIRFGFFNYEECLHMLKNINKVSDQPLIILNGSSGSDDNVLHDLAIDKGSSTTIFLNIQPSDNVKIGESYELGVRQLDSHSKELLGGMTYQIEFVPPTEE